MDTVGTRVLKQRRQLGLTQEKLAKLLDYASKGTIAKIENGNANIPISRIKDYAEALKTTTAYLLGEVSILETLHKEQGELIKASLLKQLKTKKANVAHFTDLVEDYLNLWWTQKALQADIRSRGVVFEDNSSQGHKMQKNNPSIKEQVQVNRQMLAILRELNITTDDAGAGGYVPL